MEAEREWVEWGVRRTWGVVGSIAWFERDRRTAAKCAREWPGILVRRIVTASDWTETPRLSHRTAPLAPEQPAAAPEPHPTHDEPQEGA